MNEKLTNLEIHTLVCSRDVTMAVNAFNSLQKYEEFKNVVIYLHDDGSLSEVEKEILTKIHNSVFISRDRADREIKNFLLGYPNCLEYRLGDNKINLWHKIKLFDYLFFSETKKILGMDSDLLFIHKPESVINFIQKNIPFYYPDVQSSYCFNETKNEISVIPNVNTGLIFIPSHEYYNLNSIEFALSNLVGNGINNFPSWIEQSAFAHMFYIDGNYVSLPTEKYRIPYFQDINIDKVECLHFVSYPPVREIYTDYVKYNNRNDGVLIYEKSFIKKFDIHKIPLNIKIYKHENYLSLEYYWGLEQTEQKFLDHIFRINSNDSVIEKKFESNKNGFFIFKVNQEEIMIEHTFDWYGQIKWECLDIVQIKER